MRELDKVLDKNEKVLWEGKPKFWPFFLGGSIIIMLIWIFLLPFFIIPGIIVFIALILVSPYSIFLLPVFAFLTVLVIFAPVIYIGLVHKHMHYTITDKRVIIQKGLIGRDFQFIDYDKMTNAQVNVGVFDKLFGGGNCGSIIITSAGVGSIVSISNVENPYEVFKFFKKVSFDVKTDIEYPNKMRPKANPGYPSDYNPGRTMVSRTEALVLLVGAVITLSAFATSNFSQDITTGALIAAPVAAGVFIATAVVALVLTYLMLSAGPTKGKRRT